MSQPVSRFSGAQWLALGALGAGLVTAAMVQVFVGLAPLQKLLAAPGKVRSGETQRLEGEFPTEVMPLVAEFNTVVAENADVVGRARTPAGNLAHALKTPLSVLFNAALPPDAQDRGLCRLVIDQTGMARRQADYHLARLQAAASARIPGTRTPVSQIIEGLARTMRRIHADRQLVLTVMPASTSLSFRGEAQELQEMLGNLLDNACKWASHRLEISTCSEDDQLHIVVDDDGAGLAVEQRDAVIRRGARADEQVPGSGLGQAIIDDLVHLSGSPIVLADSPLGGLRSALVLPPAR